MPIDVRVRKVKVLQGRALKEAIKKGLDLNDLVLVTVITNIEKIVGDPVSYLLKQCRNKQLSSPIPTILEWDI